MFCHRLSSLLPCSIALAVALALASCGSSRTPMRAHSSSHAAKPAVPASPSTFVIPASADDPTRRLLTEARSWLGTSYKYGGEDADGVDCSGFVWKVFDRSLHIKLPRNSAKQEEYCRTIDRGQLSEGDLVFFTTRGSSGVGHVGIYIGNGQMIHSSSSKGVIITALDQPYYVANYYSSGRVEKFYAMKDAAPRKTVPAAEEVLMAKTEPAATRPEVKAQAPATTTAQTSQTEPRTVHFTKSSVPSTTAASMERDKQKALNALLSQIEDSIFATK